MSAGNSKKANLAELARLIGGKVVGDDSIVVSRLMPTNLAAAGDITFVSNAKYLPMLENSPASAVIVHPGYGYEGRVPRIETDNPYLAFAKVQTFFSVRRPDCQGVSEQATVAGTAQLGEEVTVSPGCCVGENVRIGRGTYLYPGVVLYDNVVIGEDCLLHAGAVVREECRLGNRVVLQPNAVIGGDGFGFAPDGEKYFKIPQIGNVVLEDDVEIGACTCIDRAAMGKTLIASGTKIDNLVQIGHNAQIGENTVIVSQAGIAGSTVVGRHCTFGGQSGSVGHIKVGDNVTVAARGTTTADIEPNQVVSGFPMMPHKEWLKASTVFAKLPEMRKELSRLQKQIEELERRIEEN